MPLVKILNQYLIVYTHNFSFSLTFSLHSVFVFPSSFHVPVDFVIEVDKSAIKVPEDSPEFSP